MIGKKEKKNDEREKNQKKEKERKSNQSKKYGKAAVSAVKKRCDLLLVDRMVTCYLAGMCRICIPDERKGSRNCRRDCNPFFND